MAGEPVVILQAGGALFFFGPGAFCIIVQVLLDADPGVAAVDEVSLDCRPVLGGFDAKDAPLVLERLDGRLDGVTITIFFQHTREGHETGYL